MTEMEDKVEAVPFFHGGAESAQKTDFSIVDRGESIRVLEV